jgi:hypothetical protein
MIAREKASQLIVNYQLRCTSLGYQQAKQCALIAVDEILEGLNNDNIIYGSEYRYEVSTYYENVKKELEHR